MCQRLCPVCMPPEPEQRGVSTTSNRVSFLWNGPVEVSPSGGYRPAPCKTAGTLYREEEDVD